MFYNKSSQKSPFKCNSSTNSATTFKTGIESRMFSKKLPDFQYALDVKRIHQDE